MDNSKEVDSVAKTAADKFDMKLQLLIGFLENNKKGSKGFYWEHYVPFFIELKAKNYTNTVSHIIHYYSDKESQVWANLHSDKIDEFHKWLETYQW